eukprot:m.40506 g.40506  ORF g.40506 m.40506 type:complete len:457 (-) comp9669_c0_seq1:128-1498(-)
MYKIVEQGSYSPPSSLLFNVSDLIDIFWTRLNNLQENVTKSRNEFSKLGIRNKKREIQTCIVCIAACPENTDDNVPAFGHLKRMILDTEELLTIKHEANIKKNPRMPENRKQALRSLASEFREDAMKILSELTKACMDHNSPSVLPSWLRDPKEQDIIFNELKKENDTRDSEGDQDRGKVQEQNMTTWAENEFDDKSTLLLTSMVVTYPGNLTNQKLEFDGLIVPKNAYSVAYIEVDFADISQQCVLLCKRLKRLNERLISRDKKEVSEKEVSIGLDRIVSGCTGLQTQFKESRLSVPIQHVLESKCGTRNILEDLRGLLKTLSSMDTLDGVHMKPMKSSCFAIKFTAKRTAQPVIHYYLGAQSFGDSQNLSLTNVLHKAFTSELAIKVMCEYGENATLSIPPLSDSSANNDNVAVRLLLSQDFLSEMKEESDKLLEKYFALVEEKKLQFWASSQH